MRLPLLAVVAAGLSLTQCQFSGLGLGEDGGEDTTAAQTTSEASTTAPDTDDPDPTTSSSPTTEGDEDCGNAQIDPGEGCDNGMLNNGMNGSICKSDCQLNSCGDNYPASNEGCDDGNVADGDGCSADCKLEGCGDGVLKPPEECDDNNVLDGDGCSSLCKLPFCGDNTKDPGEECDAGTDNLDTNACTSMCKTAVCGDGLVLAGVEACDDGNADEVACTNMCLLPTCGDTIVQPPEECDDGQNGNPDDTCTDLCKTPVCGDGLVQPSIGEQCDDAGDNGDNKICTVNCKDATCGDGLLLEGVELCDDGNVVDTDDCRKDCTPAKCGDNVINVGKETCDDGNTDPNDGCSATCQKECGNSITEPGEECDDGANGDNADTCDASCKRLRYHVFVTSAQYPADFGGVVEADKACNTLATAGKLPGAGNFKAWLSNLGDTDTPAGRLFKSGKPYILTTKVKVADNWTDLVDGTPLVQQINVTEAKVAATMANPANCNGQDADKTLVWTNSDPAGMSLGDHCTNWSVKLPEQTGGVGMLNRKDALWTNACPLACDKMARFYCIEQPVP